MHHVTRLTAPRRALSVLALALLVPLLSACGFNTIPTNEERAKAAWSEVLNQYQRRADLIPNLVETVKGYAAQEKDVLTSVVEARAKAPADRPQCDEGFSGEPGTVDGCSLAADGDR
jgi:LemA protein